MKKFLQIFTAISVLVILPFSLSLATTSDGYYESGDTDSAGTTVNWVNNNEMNQILNDAGCDNTDIMEEKMSTMTDAERETYLGQQAERLSAYQTANGQKCSIVYNQVKAGDADASKEAEDEGKVIKKTEEETNIKASNIKTVTNLGNNTYIAIYYSDASGSSAVTQHVCFYVQQSHTCSFPGNIGQEAAQPQNTEFSCNFDGENGIYKLGDILSLSGNHYVDRDLDQSSYTEPVSCLNTITYACSCGATTSTGCSATSTRIVYGTPTYTEIPANVLLQFVGFRINGVSQMSILAGAPVVTPGVYSSPNTPFTFEENDLQITSIIPSELQYDSATGLSKAKIIATCNGQPKEGIYLITFSPNDPDDPNDPGDPDDPNNPYPGQLKITSVRDLRWDSSNRYYLPNLSNTTILRDVLKGDTLKMGYATQFEFTTIDAGNSYLQIDVSFLDNNGNAISAIRDAIKDVPLDSIYTKIKSTDSAARNKFLLNTTSLSGENNGVSLNKTKWNWLYYMPPKISGTAADPITVKFDITLRDPSRNSPNNIIYNYTKYLNNNGINWNGRVFKYSTSKSLLDDINGNINY